MVIFISGFMLGGLLGVLLMACIVVGSEADRVLSDAEEGKEEL